MLSHMKIEFIFNILENVSISIIRCWCDEWHWHILHLFPLSMISIVPVWNTVKRVGMVRRLDCTVTMTASNYAFIFVYFMKNIYCVECCWTGYLSGKINDLYLGNSWIKFRTWYPGWISMRFCLASQSWDIIWKYAYTTNFNSLSSNFPHSSCHFLQNSKPPL
jgi:hypothetical protein